MIDLFEFSFEIVEFAHSFFESGSVDGVGQELGLAEAFSEAHVLGDSILKLLAGFCHVRGNSQLELLEVFDHESFVEVGLRVNRNNFVFVIKVEVLDRVDEPGAEGLLRLLDQGCVIVCDGESLGFAVPANLHLLLNVVHFLVVCSLKRGLSSALFSIII